MSIIIGCHLIIYFFFFNDTATTEIYTLSLHDALPICKAPATCMKARRPVFIVALPAKATDRKSTRLNSSHVRISYAVFCLKKKNIQRREQFEGSCVMVEKASW